jgi:hypothetical protein
MARNEWTPAVTEQFAATVAAATGVPLGNFAAPVVATRGSDLRVKVACLTGQSEPTLWNALSSKAEFLFFPASLLWGRPFELQRSEDTDEAEPEAQGSNPPFTVALTRL